MSAVAWIILVVFVLPLIFLLGWALLRSSFVRVPSGNLGLVMIKGRATDKALPPGPHFVPALRRHMIEEYPSVEQVFRTGEVEDSAPMTSFAPSLSVLLGDFTTVTVDVSVRYRIIPEQLRMLHERYGPTGIAAMVRDETTRAVRNTFGDPDFGVKNLLGKEREETERTISVVLAEVLQTAGISLSSLGLGVVDLGRAGEAVEAAGRAAYELEREQAEAGTRLARAHNDAELQRVLDSGTEGSWRYRAPDLLRDLSHRNVMVNIALPSGKAESGDKADQDGDAAGQLAATPTGQDPPASPQ